MATKLDQSEVIRAMSEMGDELDNIIELDSYFGPDVVKKHLKNLRVGVIIQARMTSKRFPGKSMALFDGRPLLQRVIERACQIKPVKKIILAVPDTEASEPMLELASYLQKTKDPRIDNFCGPEDDVLKRFNDAAYYFKLDIIIRLTGDCPFVNPDLCSKVLALMLWRKPDYCSNIFPTRTYPKGLDCEAFTFDALNAAHEICSDPYDREHVTPWMQREAEVKKTNVKQKEDRSFINYCVDYPTDIERLEKIIRGEKADVLGLVPTNVKN